jgi:hypothetical protein
MSAQVTAAMRHFDVSIHLGNEKKRDRPEKEDSEARLAVVRKGARKLGKWLGGTEVKTLKISWHEPPKTYTEKGGFRRVQGDARPEGVLGSGELGSFISWQELQVPRRVLARPAKGCDGRRRHDQPFVNMNDMNIQ